MTDSRPKDVQVPVTTPIKSSRGTLPFALWLGFALLLPVLLMALVPDLLTTHDPTSSVADPLLGPSAQYWLGTDEVGRDIYSRVIHAARIEILVSLSSALLAAAIGVAIGQTVGYFGGLVDAATMRVVDVLLAFPTVVLALFLITVMGRGTGVVILAISLVMFPSMARFSRGLSIELKGRYYVDSSRVSGLTPMRIIRSHILPNSFSPTVTATSVLASSAVLLAAALSYLGLGAPPPAPTWGGMLQSAFSYVYDAPWYGIVPGLCVVLLAGSYTALGVGARAWFRTLESA